MDRIWQWAWNRHGARYSWAICAMSLPSVLLAYVPGSFLIVAVEDSDHYVEAAIAPVIAAPVLVYGVGLAGMREGRIVEHWAAGREIDRATALESTYAWTRGAIVRGVVSGGVWCAVVSAINGAIAGAAGSRLLQYGILGAAVGAA